MALLQPKYIIGTFGVIALIIVVSLAQEMNRRMAVQREVQRLEQEVAAMHKAVIETGNLNNYFRTDAYQDRLAREKLNYQAPGEKLVLIPRGEDPLKEGSETAEQAPKISIPMQWWRVMFVDGLPGTSNAP